MDGLTLLHLSPWLRSLITWNGAVLQDAGSSTASGRELFQSPLWCGQRNIRSLY